MQRSTLALNIALVGLLLGAVLLTMTGGAAAYWPWETQAYTEPIGDLLVKIAKMLFGGLLAIVGVLFLAAIIKASNTMRWLMGIVLLVAGAVLILGVI
jgi:hypothetical protein